MVDTSLTFSTKGEKILRDKLPSGANEVKDP